MASAGNLSQQIATLGRALPHHVKTRWNNGYRSMCQDIAGVLEEKIAREVFARQAEPSGASWDAIAPLTVKVRKGTGKGGGNRLGGQTLPRSFKRNQRGNELTIRVRHGMTFGSKLRANGKLVARTFAERFKMPKTVKAVSGGGKSAKFYKRKLAQKRNKGARIRGFMLAVAGVGAPAAGKQLTHPARPIIYWTPAWERACLKVANVYVTKAFVAARRDVTSEIDVIRQREIALHRTSRVG